MDKKVYSGKCHLCVLKDGYVSVNFSFCDEDLATLREIFAGKDIDFNDGVGGLVYNEIEPIADENFCDNYLPKGCVTISGVLKLQDRNCTPNPRVADVVFLAECRNCGDIVDVSDCLTMAQKKSYISQFGVEFVNEKWQCKHVDDLEFCLNCKKMDV